MKLSDFQKQVFQEIQNIPSSSSLYKTKNFQKRLYVYHRGMKSRLKQALQSDFEDSLPLLNNFEELFDEFFESLHSYHFSLSEYYKLWEEWIAQNDSITESLKALTHLERLQQDSYFMAYNLEQKPISFYLQNHKVLIHPSLIVEQFSWDVSTPSNMKKQTCYFCIWTEQATVYLEDITEAEHLLLSKLLQGHSLEQSLSPIEKIYKKDELLAWLQETMQSWTANKWLSLSDSN